MSQRPNRRADRESANSKIPNILSHSGRRIKADLGGSTECFGGGNSLRTGLPWSLVPLPRGVQSPRVFTASIRQECRRTPIARPCSSRRTETGREGRRVTAGGMSAAFGCESGESRVDRRGADCARSDDAVFQCFQVPMLVPRLFMNAIGFHEQARPWCRRSESNRHGIRVPLDFESSASTSSATPAPEYD